MKIGIFFEKVNLGRFRKISRKQGGNLKQRGIASLPQGGWTPLYNVIDSV